MLSPKSYLVSAMLLNCAGIYCHNNYPQSYCSNKKLLTCLSLIGTTTLLAKFCYDKRNSCFTDKEKLGITLSIIMATSFTGLIIATPYISSLKSIEILNTICTIGASTFTLLYAAEIIRSDTI